MNGLSLLLLNNGESDDLYKEDKKLADKLNQIDHLLTRYENDYRISMDPVTKKMIGEIDEILN